VVPAVPGTSGGESKHAQSTIHLSRARPQFKHPVVHPPHAPKKFSDLHPKGAAETEEEERERTRPICLNP